MCAHFCVSYVALQRYPPLPVSQVRKLSAEELRLLVTLGELAIVTNMLGAPEGHSHRLGGHAFASIVWGNGARMESTYLVFHRLKPDPLPR